VTPGHLVAACCFLVLAGMRAADGAWAWAGVFALAALAQYYLGSRFRAAPRAHREDRPRQASTWRLLTVSSCVLTAVLLVVQPALGLVAGVVALYCLRATRLRSSTG
jgi:hypothetical protein